LARLVCGRCGQYTEENSSYCVRDRWALLTDLPGTGSFSASLIEFEIPPGSGGFLARRRQENYRDLVERTYRANLDRRLEALEKRLETEEHNPEILRAMGLMSILEGHNERANVLLERAYKLDPNDFEITVNYAIVLAKRGQMQPAITLLIDAQKKWPKIPIVHYNLAIVALQARRPSVVHDAVSKLEGLWGENPAIAQDFHDAAVTARGMALLLEGKNHEAKAELEAAARHVVRHIAGRVERLGADDDADALEVTYTKEGEDTQLAGKTAEADGLNNLAMAEAALGNLDVAVKRLRAALALEPGHPQVLNNLGVLAYRQGRLNVAFKYLDLARQVEETLELPQSTTFNHLGVVLAALGKLDDAMEQFQSAGAGEHAEFEVYYNLGRAFIEHGKPDRGVEFLRHAFAQEPNNADVHTVLGAAYLFRGKPSHYPEALKHLKRALQVDPHHRTAAVNLALALMEIRNLDTADKIMSQARALFRDEPGVPFIQGLLILEQQHGTDENHWATAAQAFDASMAIRSELTTALYNSALCQFLMGFRDTSSKLLEICTQRDPSIGPAYYMIGFGHAVAKRNDEALRAWQIAVQYEPDNAELHANIAALLYRKADYAGAARYYQNAHFSPRSRPSWRPSVSPSRSRSSTARPSTLWSNRWPSIRVLRSRTPILAWRTICSNRWSGPWNTGASCPAWTPVTPRAAKRSKSAPSTTPSCNSAPSIGVPA